MTDRWQNRDWSSGRLSPLLQHLNPVRLLHFQFWLQLEIPRSAQINLPWKSTVMISYHLRCLLGSRRVTSVTSDAHSSSEDSFYFAGRLTNLRQGKVVKSGRQDAIGVQHVGFRLRLQGLTLSSAAYCQCGLWQLIYPLCALAFLCTTWDFLGLVCELNELI